MTFQENEFESQTAELRDEITVLDTELTEEFKSQFSIAPFLSRKIVSFQGKKRDALCLILSLQNFSINILPKKGDVK
ncbi:MAG: hypothetical protein OXI43_21390 [Candidatus Poribacteria bacterium]|nr:hypothetical protein [Candidatus Poribacteria bacterium]